ncbi:uncharacterized protein LOC122509221 [Leptopilina heterotoma]|uniref:uncharacterized protein LOC122509221 n=1 Tax=Leptopilina heterotoma TaxID=63436 RepID=UPI001CA950B8|nr:uncharacterized protein LOC122509221 [Leptopilina heterotoma]
MDAIRRQRKNLRAAFTRTHNAFDAELTQDSSKEDKIVAFELLEDRMTELTAVHSEYNKLLFESDSTEDAILRELETDDAYRMLYLKAKMAVKKITESNLGRPLSAASDLGVLPARKTLKLPTIELPKFNGNIKEWLPFWSVFKKIHEDPALTDEDKFQYLVQATAPNSRAQDLVSSFPPTAENYGKVMTSMKNRFGRDDVVVEFYVRELLALVLHNAVKGNQGATLASIFDKLEAYIRALDTLGVTTDKCAAMLYPLVESSLPEDVLRAWQRSAQRENIDTNGGRETKDRLAKLLEFLQSEVENQERIDMALRGFQFSSEGGNSKKTKGKTETVKDIASASALLTTREAKFVECVFCKSKHESQDCETARKLSLKERRECVQNSNACFVCVKKGHMAKNCRSKVRCSWCGRRHVLILCAGFPPRTDVLQDKLGENKKDYENSLATFSHSPEVCMQTLKVKVFSDRREKIVRAIIDTASQRSYIRVDIANELGYGSCGNTEIAHSLFGGVKSKIKKHEKFLIRLKSLDGSYTCNFSVLGQDVICDTIPSVQKESWLKILKDHNINLTDIESSQKTIDVLIGADIAGKLLTGNKFDLENGLVAFETLLGWTIMGKVPRAQNENDTPVAMITTMLSQEVDLTELWKLEILGITDPSEKVNKTERDIIAKNFVRETAKVTKEGRYEFKLPWREDHLLLPDNLEIAQRRLKFTVQKLKKQGFLADYGEVLKSWLDEGIIEEVMEKEIDCECHYLPHRPVFKENSTTVIRPVFDASAYEVGHPSLNQCLETGPNMIELVPDSINRFREGEIGVVSDIKRAFLQIGINENDRDFLRFLWMVGDKVTVYRHCRVVFGLSCSPFLLAAAIELLLEKALIEASESNGLSWSENSVKKLKKSFYADNCVTSVNSVDELHKFIHEGTKILSSGGFDLRLWEYSGDNSEKITTLVLGILWNKQRDSISINPASIITEIPQVITKRSILSMTHGIYDPIGFTCPITLPPKTLLAQLWAEKVDWDSRIDEKREHEFCQWAKELSSLKEIEFPRKLPEGKLTIHAFGDASGIAYAAVVFVRIESENMITVLLVSARSRIAPKKTTIPRLELLAASITARLADSVAKSFTREVEKITFWSDSTTVLAWLNRDGNWGTFVHNRVKEIRKLTNIENWKYVPGENNPADLPSRGCNPLQLVASKWWLGPEWLKKPENDWPSAREKINEVEVEREVKKSATVNMVNHESNEININSIFSSYTKLIRFIAWVRRFLLNRKLILQEQKTKQNGAFSEQNTKVKNYSSEEDRKNLYLTLSELREAENNLLRHLQKSMFQDTNKNKLSSFKTFVNKDGLYVVKTKILNRKDGALFLSPILLDKHEIITLLVRETHERIGHSGTQIVMNVLREKFWIISLRQIIRSVIAKCVICKKQKVKHMECDSPPLPENRVRDAAIFEVTGIDFAGPVFIKGGGKCWICVFTCAIYRAVHFELTSSLSVEGFVECLRRFIARRGRPQYIYSDNGTNFVGTANALEGLDWPRIIKKTEIFQIKWRFNPPAAPWWGGWWERLIGILKTILRKVLGKACLSYENLMTSLCDAESIINSRPLTYVSENSDDLIPLSPMLFLQEIKQSGTPDLDMLYAEKLNKKLTYRKKIFDDLRTRFRQEYLSQLLLKNGKKENRNVKINDIVLIGNDFQKRLDWPLARIVDFIKGRDGQIRTCILKTKSGIIKRPIQRLYPLEIHQDNEENAKNLNEKIKNKNRNLSENIVNTNKRECQTTNTVKCVREKICLDKDTQVKTKSGRISKIPDRLMY